MSQRATALRTGNKVVATAGTAVQLADSSTQPAIEPLTVVIQALGTNTGVVVVGDSLVVAAPGTQASPTQRGIRLAANDALTLDIIDIRQVWIDAVTSGDGVSWMVGVS